MLHRYPSLGLKKITALARKGFELVTDTTPQLGGPLDTNGRMIQWSKGADVASATALNLGTDGNIFDVTGTTTITSISAETQAPFVILQFDGALVLTHHSSNLILPGGKNITTVAGDIAQFVQYASGQWMCVNYQRSVQPSRAGWERLDTATFSTTASYTIGASDDGIGIENYREIQLRFSNVLPATDGVDAWIRTDSAAGDAGDSGSSDYAYSQIGINGNNSQQTTLSTGAAQILLTGASATDQVSNVAPGIYGTIDFYDFNQSGAETSILWNLSYEDESVPDGLFTMIGAGKRNAAHISDFILFQFSSGDIASGYLEVWGKA